MHGCVEMRRFLAGLVAVAAVGSAFPVQAGNGTVQMSILERAEHDTNPLMQSHGAEAVNGSVTSPELILSSDTPTDHLGLKARVDRSFYDLKGFSSTDLHSRFNGTTKGERWEAGIGIGLDYDTTRTSEQDASGLNIAGIRHTGLTFSPRVKMSVSETDSLVVDPSLMRSFYADKRRYTNYSVYSVNPTYQHDFDSRNSGQVILQTSRFQTEGTGTVIDNIGPALGWVTALSERLTASVTAGIRRTMPEFAPSSRTDGKDAWNYGYSVSLSYRGEQDVVDFSASRAPNPFATGTQAETTAISLAETHTLSPTLSYGVTVTHQRSKSSYGGIASDSTSIGLQNRLTYHVTETVDLGVEHRIRERMAEPGEGRALGNVFLARIIFTPTKLAFDW